MNLERILFHFNTFSARTLLWCWICLWLSYKEFICLDGIAYPLERMVKGYKIINNISWENRPTNTLHKSGVCPHTKTNEIARSKTKVEWTWPFMYEISRLGKAEDEDYQQNSSIPGKSNINSSPLCIRK